MRSILHKFDVVYLGSSARWHFLVMTWILVFAFYMVVLIESISPYHCLSVSEVWLGDESSVSPYFMFCFICGLLFIWAAVEHWLVWWSPKESRLTGLIITSIFMFLLASWGVALYRHWQMLELSQGERSYENYSFKFMDRNVQIPMEWEQFLKQKRCNEGIDLKNLSDEELCELEREYSDKHGGFYFVRVACMAPPKSRLDIWQEEQEKFRSFMTKYKRLLKKLVENSDDG